MPADARLRCGSAHARPAAPADFSRVLERLAALRTGIRTGANAQSALLALLGARPRRCATGRAWSPNLTNRVSVHQRWREDPKLLEEVSCGTYLIFRYTYAEAIALCQHLKADTRATELSRRALRLFPQQVSRHDHASFVRNLRLRRLRLRDQLRGDAYVLVQPPIHQLGATVRAADDVRLELGFAGKAVADQHGVTIHPRPGAGGGRPIASPSRD